MMSYRRVLTYVLMVFAMTQFIVGCTTEVDYTQGSEFIPSDQRMELRRRVYKAGEMKEGDETEICPLSSSRLYLTDSIPSANLQDTYFGQEKSDTFGTRKAGFMTQMMFSASLDKERGWGYRPIFDSMVMAFYVTGYHGDTTYKQRFNVYEITSNDYFNLPNDKDTSFCINFDPKPFISAEPIFTFTFPDQERGVYVGNVLDPEECVVRLQETPATFEYVSRLMLLNNMEANDGYALDVDSLYTVNNQSEFVNVVRGVYVVPAEEPMDGRGAMYSTEIENTYMYLYARSRYEEDPTIIRDTIGMGYNFYLSPKLYDDVKAGNVSITTVDHDFSGVTVFDASETDMSQGIDERSVVSTGFVDGMGGVVTEVLFTDEFIQSLADIVTSRKDSSVSVNQAHLSIYIDGSDYDYLALDPMMITPIMDAAMPSMGLYTDYANRATVSDYMYSTSGNAVMAFDGNLNRSLACYTMDISNYVQSLMLAASKNLLEDGVTVNLEKFSPTSDNADDALVKLRRFYVGPTMDKLFGFQRQAILGGDIATESGEKSKAPITLDVVYTIVD